MEETSRFTGIHSLMMSLLFWEFLNCEWPVFLLNSSPRISDDLGLGSPVLHKIQRTGGIQEWRFLSWPLREESLCRKGRDANPLHSIVWNTRCWWGFEPPTFQLRAERTHRLCHRNSWRLYILLLHCYLIQVESKHALSSLRWATRF